MAVQVSFDIQATIQMVPFREKKAHGCLDSSSVFALCPVAKTNVGLTSLGIRKSRYEYIYQVWSRTIVSFCRNPGKRNELRDKSISSNSLGQICVIKTPVISEPWPLEWPPSSWPDVTSNEVTACGNPQWRVTEIPVNNICRCQNSALPVIMETGIIRVNVYWCMFQHGLHELNVSCKNPFDLCQEDVLDFGIKYILFFLQSALIFSLIVDWGIPRSCHCLLSLVREPIWSTKCWRVSHQQEKD